MHFDDQFVSWHRRYTVKEHQYIHMLSATSKASTFFGRVSAHCKYYMEPNIRWEVALCPYRIKTTLIDLLEVLLMVYKRAVRCQDQINNQQRARAKCRLATRPRIHCWSNGKFDKRFFDSRGCKSIDFKKTLASLLAFDYETFGVVKGTSSTKSCPSLSGSPAWQGVAFLMSFFRMQAMLFGYWFFLATAILLDNG